MLHFHPPSIVRKIDSNAAPESCSTTFSHQQHDLSHSAEFSPEATTEKITVPVPEPCKGAASATPRRTPEPSLEVVGILDVCDCEVVTPMRPSPGARTKPMAYGTRNPHEPSLIVSSKRCRLRGTSSSALSRQLASLFTMQTKA